MEVRRVQFTDKQTRYWLKVTIAPKPIRKKPLNPDCFVFVGLRAHKGFQPNQAKATPLISKLRKEYHDRTMETFSIVMSPKGVLQQSLGETQSKGVKTLPSHHTNFQWSRKQTWNRVRVSTMYTRSFRRPQTVILLENKNNEGFLQKACWYSRAQSGKFW